MSFINDILSLSSNEGTYVSVKYSILDKIKNLVGKKIIYKADSLNTQGDTNSQFVYVINGTTRYYSVSNGVTQFEITEEMANATSFDFSVSTNNSASSNSGSYTAVKPRLTIVGNENEYEPYTGGQPSPSPEFPSEIRSVGDDINEFDINKVQIGKAWNLANNTSRAIFIKKVIPNTYYTISFEDITNIDGLYYFEKENEADTTLTVVTTQINTTVTKKILATSNYLGIQFNKDNISINDIKNIKLKIQEGKVATPYSEFGKGTIEIVQAGENISKSYILQLSKSLRSLPNGTKDTIEADGIHRRVGTAILDGSDDENWQMISGYENTFYKMFNDAKKLFLALCSHYKFTYKSLANLDVNEITTNGGGGFALWVKSTQTTLEDFKAELSQSPMQVDYELAEPTVEPFELPKMPSLKGATNITTTNEIKPVLDVTYYKDLTTLEARLEALEATLVSQGSEV